MKKLFNSICNFAACLSDVLYPPHCIVCESGLIQGETHICTFCLSSLPTVDEEYSPDSLYQRLSIELKPSFAWTYLLFDSKNKTQKILHAIKYGDAPDSAEESLQYGRTVFSICSVELKLIVSCRCHCMFQKNEKGAIIRQPELQKDCKKFCRCR